MRPASGTRRRVGRAGELEERPPGAGRPVGAAYLIYTYCVVEAGTPAHRLLEKRSVRGMEPGEPLFPIEAAGLVAAASRVPEATFREESLNAILTELPRVAPFALRHHEAIGSLAPHAPALVPMTLGAVYLTEQNVISLLRQRAPEFSRLLKRVRGKQEWGVKVFRDNVRLLEAAKRAGDPYPSPVGRGTEGEGRAYLARKQRERALAAEAEGLASRSLDDMLRRLKAVSSEVRVEGDLPAVQQASPRLVLKAAALVDGVATGSFRDAAVALQRDYEPLGFAVALDGPWAPYSFVGERRVAG